VWAVVTELGGQAPADVIDTENGMWRPYGRRVIEDVVRRERMTWAEVLINSSNVGMTKATEKITHTQLRTAVRRLGFGESTRTGLPGEATGLVTSAKNWTKYTQTSVSFGNEIAVTPVQMARAFCALARDGEMAGTLPDVRLTAALAGPGGMGGEADRGVVHRVMRPSTAVLTRGILRHVAAKMEEKLARIHKEGGWRYSLFGKSGTSKIPMGKPPAGKKRPPGSNGYFDRQYNSSFIAGGPVEAPELVILTVIDDPGPELIRKNAYYGSDVAGPVVRRVMEKSLSYLGVPPSPTLSLPEVPMVAPAGEGE
jgi:cell division protein FtsI (penicillin-binding protein 3)